MTTLANALSSVAPKVHYYFDLLGFTRKIQSPEIAAAIASSIAFRMDVMIVSAARALYKDAKKQVSDSGEATPAELKTSFESSVFVGQLLKDAGLEGSEHINTIKTLMYQRDQWHEVATTLTALVLRWDGTPMSYQPRTIEDQILNPGDMKVGAKAQSKHARAAKRAAEDLKNPELEQLSFNRRMQNAAADLERTTVALREQSRGVMTMFELALAHPLERVLSLEFSSLGKTIRGTLLMAAIAAAEREETRAANTNSIDDSTYELILDSKIKAVKELQRQLRMPEFIAAAHQEQAAAVNVG